VAASFQLADSTRDTMTRWKSCRHKTYRHLILNWFRAGGSDLIGRRRGLQRQGETDRRKSLWIENATRPGNRPVSPDGVHPTRAENIPPILLRSLLQRAASEGSFSQWEKEHHNCKSRGEQAGDKLRVGPHDAVSGAQHQQKLEVFKWGCFESGQSMDDFFHGQ